MKKLAILAVCLASALAGYSQGTFNANNLIVGSIDAPIYASDGITKLSGLAYEAQLYAGPSAAALQAVGVPIPFRTSAAAAGYFAGGTVTLPSSLGVPGTLTTVQVRAWAASAGSTYEAALATGANYGQSLSLTLASGGAGSPPGMPANLVGLQSFNLVGGAIPEPSVIALGLLGAAVLVLRRRK